jgi:hypothetical protein
VKSPLFTKPGITVIGVGGADVTTLDAGGEAGQSAVVVASFQPGSEPARVVGFTITGGGTGVGSDTACPIEVFQCQILDNTRQAIGFADATVRMQGGVISGNAGGVGGSGTVSGLSNTELELVDVTVERNTDSWGIVMLTAGPVRLSGCTFREQIVACRINHSPDLVIENCLFQRCSLGAIQSNDSSGEIRFNTFAYDTAAAGAGALLYECDILVEHNTFYRCHATESAAVGLTFQDGGVRNNIFAYCTGPGGAVGRFGGVQNSDTGCNLFWQNEGGNYQYDWIPAPTDIEADPEFCNEPTLDLSLHSTSPAAPANNACGLLGAWDVQCGPVSVAPTSWGRLKNLYREVEP